MYNVLIFYQYIAKQISNREAILSLQGINGADENILKENDKHWKIWQKEFL
ncbi:MAG: hypothetical protein ACI83O_000210 [Patescibacteria group bacterium]